MREAVKRKIMTWLLSSPSTAVWRRDGALAGRTWRLDGKRAMAKRCDLGEP